MRACSPEVRKRPSRPWLAFFVPALFRFVPDALAPGATGEVICCLMSSCFLLIKVSANGGEFGPGARTPQKVYRNGVVTFAERPKEIDMTRGERRAAQRLILLDQNHSGVSS